MATEVKAVPPVLPSTKAYFEKHLTNVAYITIRDPERKKPYSKNFKFNTGLSATLPLAQTNQIDAVSHIMQGLKHIETMRNGPGTDISIDLEANTATMTTAEGEKITVDLPATETPAQ